MLMPPVAAAAIRILGRLVRIEMTDPCGFLKYPPDRPVIFVFWHNRLLLMPYVLARFLPNRRAVALVSARRDGELLTRTLGPFGVATVRGSSSRKGAHALRELHEALENGCDAAITPDGPRGPCYTVHPGAAGLARSTGLDLVPVGYNCVRCVRIRSWDRFMIPLPLARVEFHFGPPLRCEAGESDERMMARLKDALMALTKD